MAFKTELPTRMMITLSPELAVALGGLGDALGRPPATIAREMLVEIIPQLEGLTKLAIAAKSGNKVAAKRALVHMMGDNMAEIMSMQQPELFGKAKRK